MVSPIRFKDLLQQSCTDYEEYCWVHTRLASNQDPFEDVPESPYTHRYVDLLHVLHRHYPEGDVRFRTLITCAKSPFSERALTQELIDLDAYSPKPAEGTNILYLVTTDMVPHINIFRHGLGSFDQPSMMGTQRIGGTAVSVYESIRSSQN